jgi:hypothetical protein
MCNIFLAPRKRYNLARRDGDRATNVEARPALTNRIA